MKHIITALLIATAAPAAANETYVACLRTIVVADALDERIKDEFAEILVETIKARDDKGEVSALAHVLYEDLQAARIKFQTALGEVCAKLRD